MITLLIWLSVTLLISAGLAGLVLPALPGPLLLLAGLWIAAWAEDYNYVGMTTLIILCTLALVASLADYVAGALGARRYGASARSIWGATWGALIGLFFGLPGLLLGPFVGAAIGEWSTLRNVTAAGRAGLGATIGLVLGIAAKLALGMSMLGVFVIVRFL